MTRTTTAALARIGAILYLAGLVLAIVGADGAIDRAGIAALGVGLVLAGWCLAHREPTP